MTRLLVLGDYSGRNTGHNAHLLSAAHELRQAFDGCELLLPTLAPQSIAPLCAAFADIRPFGVAPWNGSLKFAGVPMQRALARAEALILADNMFYDNHLYNPMKNNLLALEWLTRAATKRGLPVVYYNAGVGPANHTTGRAIIRRLAARMDLTLLRDNESGALYETLTGRHAYRISADSGFNMPWQRLKDSDAARQAGAEGATGDLIAVNLSRHLQAWLAGYSETERQALQAGLARALTALAEQRGARLVFVVAHPGDRDAADSVSRHLAGDDFEVWEEDGGLVYRIAAHIERFRALIGTRYHEIVLFASAHIPVLGLDCGEKLDGLFQTLQCPQNLLDSTAIGAPQGADALLAALAHAGDSHSAFKRTCQALAERGRQGAAAARELI